MLALTRRTQERIVLSNGVIFTITKVKGNQVRVAIDAPKSIGVFREEILSPEQRLMYLPDGQAS